MFAEVVCLNSELVEDRGISDTGSTTERLWKATELITVLNLDVSTCWRDAYSGFFGRARQLTYVASLRGSVSTEWLHRCHDAEA